MASKFIKIPGPISPLPGAPLYTFTASVAFVVDNEPRFQAPASNARRGMRILEALDAEVNGIVELREDDHKFLNDVFENPTCGYGRWNATFEATGEVTELKVPTRKYMTFIDAVDQATNSRPASVAPEDAKSTNGAAASAAS